MLQSQHQRIERALAAFPCNALSAAEFFELRDPRRVRFQVRLPGEMTDISAKHPHEIHREDERIDFPVRLARIIESRVRLALETRKTPLEEPMQALVALENHLVCARKALRQDGSEQNRVADATLTDHEEALDRRTTPFIEPGVRPEHVRGVVV